MPETGIGRQHFRHEERRIANKEPDGDLDGMCRLEYSRIQSFLGQNLSDPVLKDAQRQTRLSLQIAQEAISKYGLDHLSLSYNGGKDCLVLLIVYLAAIHAHRIASSSGVGDSSGGTLPSLPPKLRSIYILPPHQFPEVDAFVKASAEHYQLKLTSSEKSMKSAFEDYLAGHPEVKAIFVGTRRTDPHGGTLKHFDPTDRGWPSFMRIHPVIDWHYREIWAFLRHLEIPYCSLYDKGYTSLGGTNDTAPNPKLRNTDSGTNSGPDGHEFRPAYTLMEDDEERLGRENRSE